MLKTAHWNSRCCSGGIQLFKWARSSRRPTLARLSLFTGATHGRRRHLFSALHQLQPARTISRPCSFSCSPESSGPVRGSAPTMRAAVAHRTVTKNLDPFPSFQRQGGKANKKPKTTKKMKIHDFNKHELHSLQWWKSEYECIYPYCLFSMRGSFLFQPNKESETPQLPSSQNILLSYKTHRLYSLQVWLLPSQALLSHLLYKTLWN